VRALEDSGFVIEALREPRQRDDVAAADPAEERWRRIPQFLYLRVVSVGRKSSLESP